MDGGREAERKRLRRLIWTANFSFYAMVTALFFVLASVFFPGFHREWF